MSVLARLSMAALLTTILLASGCAALSLFDQAHTHHHHYDCDSSDVATRLESLERRLAQMEKPGASGVQFSSHEVSE